MTLMRLHFRPTAVAEKRSLEHVREAVLFLPARESCTVMSMQEGRRASQSVVESQVGVAEQTWISINAEPKLPECNVCQYS